MEEKKCKECGYFRQHYALDDRKIFRVYCGHCVFSTPRGKRPDKPACENFVLGTADADAFATKEYLSKALLQYLLELDILPEIVDDPGLIK